MNKFLNTAGVLNHTIIDHKAELCKCLPLKGDSAGTGTENAMKQLPVEETFLSHWMKSYGSGRDVRCTSMEQ